MFFLRDPASRFVSGFYTRLRQGIPNRVSPWSPEETEVFLRFRTPNELAEALPGAAWAMRSVYHIRTRYSYWLRDEAYLLSRRHDLFFVGFQETLDADFEQLTRRLGVRAVLPDDDTTAHRNSDLFDRDLSPLALEHLRDWYSEVNS